ncbi:hypothetical protein FNV43_RR10847 [Rhamnella rubrinervis]|uniref:RNase H type-1 domain-containing protein n=1 Tax=Rhamnella rubrinervis TaxID=2594499 RepID=A0A8K0MH34_9ROSA|nr:hypothetical protein FNV43_RR10847 [Rhamnella rubrinervis]
MVLYQAIWCKINADAAFKDGRAALAMAAVKEVLSDSDPCAWDTRSLVINCRNLLRNNEWRLKWNARSANLAADFIAKFSFSSNVILSCNQFDASFSSLSKDFVDIILLDQVSAGLV